MKKYFTINDKGSALIFTILIIFILSILGSVLISVAMSNFKLIRHGNDYDTVFYIVDGAADEVIDEMAIISNNAEFYALDQIKDYAKTIKSSHVSSSTVDEVTTYTHHLGAYKADLADEYEDIFLEGIADTLITPITVNYEFDPALGNSFDESNPIKVEITSPVTFDIDNISDDGSIKIKVSGFYNGLQRNILLDYKIHVPQYTFKGKEAGPYILYDGYDVRGNTTPGLDLVSWKESNINE